MSKLSKSKFTMFISAFIATFAPITIFAQSVLAKTPDNPCTLPGSKDFFGFPHWWKYLGGDFVGGSCTPFVNWPGGIWAIALAIIDILLRVAGMAAVISLIVASVMYVTSAGDTNRTSAALNRIINSLVGLAIVLVAAGVVAFIGNRLVVG